MSKHRSYHQAKQEFLNYYCRLLPQYSPESLDSYLTRRNPPVLLISPLHEPEIRSLWNQARLTYLPLDWFPHACSWPQDVPPGTSLPGFVQGWLYALNPSSLFPVLALDPHPTDSILDASAAPGGKTLAIINKLVSQVPGWSRDSGMISGPDLLANDVSLPRFKRLRSSLKLYGYPNIPVLCSPIQALKYKLQSQFNKILLDAPCSSEKHVFNSKRHLKIWSPNRTLNLSHLQALLLDSLIPLLKPDGRLVYSTCSISPRENQEVIDSVLAKHSELKQIPFDYSLAPHADPIFIAILSRQN